MLQTTHPNLKEFGQRYREEHFALYQDFTCRLHELVKELTHDLDELIHKTEARVKTVDSFVGKLERKSTKYTDPFTEITDLAGVRVITFYHESVQMVVEILRREFEVDESNSHDKIHTLKADEFGYRSVHLVVSLSDARVQLEEWKRFAGLKAEIQVRSILQHAWANMSHKFDYKVTDQAPPELRRRLFRLSALLELADEEFRALLDQAADISTGYRSHMRQGRLDLPLNLDSLREFLHQTVDLYHWEQVGIAAGMTPFTDPEIARQYFPTGLEILLLTLQTVGVKTIAEFESLLLGFDKLHTPLERFVRRVHAQGETVHALPLEVLILLTSVSQSMFIPPEFDWGGKYKPFFIKALREVCSEQVAGNAAHENLP
jgi:putative GTP pyrophosphokinase